MHAEQRRPGLGSGRGRPAAQVDTELVYAYAKTGDLGALEEFVSGAQQANLQARARRA